MQALAGPPAQLRQALPHVGIRFCCLPLKHVDCGLHHGMQYMDEEEHTAPA